MSADNIKKAEELGIEVSNKMNDTGNYDWNSSLFLTYKEKLWELCQEDDGHAVFEAFETASFSRLNELNPEILKFFN